jgi:hypothetical protein
MTGSPVVRRRAFRLAVCLALTAAGASLLLLFGGPFLGGVLAFWWVAGWSVPLAVFMRRTSTETPGADDIGGPGN